MEELLTKWQAAQRGPVYGSVPQLFPGLTVVCLAAGPSLTQADMDACRDRARIIAIKDVVFLAPWADVLYAGDERWLHHHGPSLTFPGPRYTLRGSLDPGPWATVLRLGAVEGLELRRDSLAYGYHSGYQAINLAVHLGAAKIVLLGYDMQPGPDGRHHVFGNHPYPKKTTPYHFLPYYASLVEPLARLRIPVLNATRTTAIDCFPRVSLEEALA